jgi:hypothetical protein
MGTRGDAPVTRTFFKTLTASADSVHHWRYVDQCNNGIARYWNGSDWLYLKTGP